MDAVSAVLVRRTHDAERLGPLVGWSLLVHVVLTVLVAVVPAGWLGLRTAAEPEVVMQISLGGAVGPRDGGLATLGGRPVQQVQPEPAKKAVEAVRPPAAKAPEMIEPTKAPPRNSRHRRSRPRPGPTRDDADQRRRGPGRRRRRADRRSRPGLRPVGGRQRDRRLPGRRRLLLPRLPGDDAGPDQPQLELAAGGPGDDAHQVRHPARRRITNVQVERSSGVAALDYYSQRAMSLTRQLPPLPAAYAAELTVHLNMDYIR